MLFSQKGVNLGLFLSLFAGLVCFSSTVFGAKPMQDRRAPDSSAQVETEFRIAREAEQKGDYDKAASAYRAILELRPDLAEIHQNLGLVYYMQAKNREAIDIFPGCA